MTGPEIEDIRARLEAAKSSGGLSESQTRENDAQNQNQGLRAGVELIAAILASGAVGFGIDHIFDTRPFGFMIMLFLGIFTGFYNVWRVMNNMSISSGFQQLQTGQKNANTAPIDMDRP